MSDLDYSLSVVNKVNDICRPFFDETGISFFWFVRLYNDGTTMFLFTDPSLFYYHEKENYFSNFDDLTTFTRYTFLSPVGIPATVNYEKFSKIAINTYDKLGLFDFFIIADYYKDFIESGCFGSPAKNSKKSIYLPLISEINRFLLSFKYQARDMIQTANLIQNRVFVKNYKDCLLAWDINCFNQKIENLIETMPSKTFSCQVNKNEVFLTKRQLECFALYSQGKSAKEIAKSLNISYRTVEIHIQKLKEKLGCFSRSSFSDIISHNPFLKDYVLRSFKENFLVTSDR